MPTATTRTGATPPPGLTTTAPRGAPWSGAGSTRWWLLGIVVLGVALRVAWALYATRQPVGLHDPTFYTVFAEEIARGNGYRLPDGQPTAYYPVGYPAVLGALFWLADHSPLPDGRMGLVVGLNLACAASSLVLVFLIGRRLFDQRVALLAAGIMAVFPNLVFHAALALTETLFITLALLAVLVLVSTPWERRPLGALVGFGLLVGLSALVRPPSLLFLPVLALVGWWGAGWGWRAVGRSVLVAGLAAVAVIAPWTLRNAVVMTSPVIISTNMGDNLCIGNNPEATGAFQMPPSCLDGYDHLERPEYELRRDAEGRRKGLEHILGQPADQLRLVPLRLFHTFKDDTDGLHAAESYGADPFIPPFRRSILEAVANAVFFATLLTAMAAMPWLLRGRDPGRLLLLLSAVSLVLPPLVFFGDVRFHVPMIPFQVLAAAALLGALADMVRARWAADR